MRSEQDVNDYPARNARLLAALLMYAFTPATRPSRWLGSAPPPFRRPLRAQPQQPTYVGPPARLQQLPTTGDPATQWSFQPAPGRLTHAKSSEARGGQPPYSASTDQQARVSFDVAQTRDGRPYENELLPLDDLRVAVV